MIPRLFGSKALGSSRVPDLRKDVMTEMRYLGENLCRNEVKSFFIVENIVFYQRKYDFLHNILTDGRKFSSEVIL